MCSDSYVYTRRKYILHRDYRWHPTPRNTVNTHTLWRIILPLHALNNLFQVRTGLRIVTVSVSRRRRSACLTWWTWTQTPSCLNASCTSWSRATLTSEGKTLRCGETVCVLIGCLEVWGTGTVCPHVHLCVCVLIGCLDVFLCCFIEKGCRGMSTIEGRRRRDITYFSILVWFVHCCGVYWLVWIGTA